jgi:hypothetical protein
MNRRQEKVGVCFYLMFVLVLCFFAGCFSSGCGAVLPPNYAAEILLSRFPPDKKEITYRIGGGPRAALFDVRKITEEGIRLWDYTLRYQVTLRPARDGEAEDITVQFVKAGSLGGKTVGKCRRAIGPDLYLRRAEIELDSALWVNPALLKSASAHETGHGLGVGGHTELRGRLMFATIPQVAFVQLEDHNTLRLSYVGAVQRALHTPASAEETCELEGFDPQAVLSE